MTRHTHTEPASSAGKKHAVVPANGTSEHDAIALLSEDHKKVRGLFDQFKKMKEGDDVDSESKRRFVEQTCSELRIHTQLEEEIFYPAMREAIHDADLLNEAAVEHASAKQFIAQLSRMDPADELYDAMFTVLGEYVNHHIEEEEKEMFKKARNSDADLHELGAAMEQRRTQLRDRTASSPKEGNSQKRGATKKSLH